MHYFTSKINAVRWASTYGCPRPFSVTLDTVLGLWVVTFDYNEPRGAF
jgi:hypothetical protein